MTDDRRPPRYRVNDLGYGYAVHDTRAQAPYEFPAGRDKPQRSNNAFNTRIVEIFPTRAQAQARADELNRSDSTDAA
jgi:hypothetical protein